MKSPSARRARVISAMKRGHRGRADDGLGRGLGLAAAVAVEHDVLRQQRLQRGQVAVLGRGQEALQQRAALLGIGIEARPLPLDVPAGAHDELTQLGSVRSSTSAIRE